MVFEENEFDLFAEPIDPEFDDDFENLNICSSCGIDLELEENSGFCDGC